MRSQVLEKLEKQLLERGWRSEIIVVNVRPGIAQCMQCGGCGEEAGAISAPVTSAGNHDRTYSLCEDKA